MIFQLQDPPSSVLLERRIKDDSGEEYLFVTQINNVKFTKIEEFYSYFNEVDRNVNSSSPLRRVVDSNFVAVPLEVIKDFLKRS